MINPSYAVVIPTIGRPGLAELVAIVDGDPAPTSIVVVDDRRVLPLSWTCPRLPPRSLSSSTHGRGPAAARNAGWHAADAEWIAFLDDDVTGSARLVPATGQRSLRRAGPGGGLAGLDLCPGTTTAPSHR